MLKNIQSTAASSATTFFSDYLIGLKKLSIMLVPAELLTVLAEEETHVLLSFIDKIPMFQMQIVSQLL